MSAQTPFGAPMRKHFLVDPGFLNLNHGSFGTHPEAVRTVLREYQDEIEARPDPFIRYRTPELLDASRAAVANMLNVSRKECVFVKNATTGVNTILRNIPFQPGDVIVYFDTVYGAVEKGIISLMESTPLQARKVEYECPISHDDLVSRFQDVVRATRAEGLNVKIALFDVITSMPAMRFPFERLTEICREEGILSLIDGAHGVGQIPLDLGKLQPDFFASNCHKWLFVPRSCCVLYVAKRSQHLIRTTIPTSWGFIPPPDAPETAPSVIKDEDPTKTAFESLFEFVATNDDTPYFCIPAALKFRNEVCGGEDRIYAYLETLANEAGDVVAGILGTDVLQEPNLAPGTQSQLRRCAMSTVRLPIAVGQSGTSEKACAVVQEDQVGSVVSWFQTTLTNKYSTFVPVFAHGGWMWTRLSAQVYLDRQDFEWLAGVLKDMCGDIKETGLVISN